MEYEYSRFGDGFVRRVKDSSEDWAACQLDDVPAEVLQEEQRVKVREGVRDAGGSGDPFHKAGLERGSTILVGGGAERQGPAVGVRKANPEVDAIAAELGLTPDQLRGRLNGEAGGTVARVSEERFDEIAARLGLDPVEARARFGDRSDQVRPRE